MEIDGIPLTGPVSISNPVAAYYTRTAYTCNWKTWDQQWRDKNMVVETNQFKQGGSDNYKLIGQVPVSKNNFSFSVKNSPSDFYKIVFEAPHNLLNRMDNFK